MVITEEQRQRAEANRLAALEKRKAFNESLSNQQNQQHIQWRFVKCRKLSPHSTSTSSSTAHYLKPPSSSLIDRGLSTNLPQKFQVHLEICSPDSFSITPEALEGFAYPGDEECLMRLTDCLNNVLPSHYTQNHGGGKACVFKIRDYDDVLMALKNYKSIEIQKIPFSTLNVIQRLSRSMDGGRWEPCRPEHLNDENVNELIEKLPRKLLSSLLPFQLDGLRFGLRRGGRCLIADEMGLGKTLQAIAIAGCFMDEGHILIVCPAVLRYSWAEELERWLPSFRPSEIHLVFGHQNNPANLTIYPKVVVISYTMLHHLRKSILEQEWGLLIIDESHQLRCSKKRSEPKEIQAVLDVAAKVKRIVLLSGTPSLSRPGLLGQNKYDFAKTYCAVSHVQTFDGKGFQDFSKGIRLVELNVLLTQAVMIRRLKKHVSDQLPPKRRQIIRLVLKRSDIISAKSATGANPDAVEDNEVCCGKRQLSYQELGIAKLSGFLEWLSIHPLLRESDGAADSDVSPGSQKMIVFAHHHKVLDSIQNFLCEKGVGFVRIDGTTLASDRQHAVLSFRSSNEVKVAIIGIRAGGVGLDFSTAQNVVFLELPQSPSELQQAEDRAHRRGQTNAVNIYLFCAKDTLDEKLWQNLNQKLYRVSSTTNGKYDAMPEIAVDCISYLNSYNGNNLSAKNIAPGEEPSTEQPPKESMKLGDSCSQQEKMTSKVHSEVVGTNGPSKHLDAVGDADQIDDLHAKDSVFGSQKDIHVISAHQVEGKVSETVTENHDELSCNLHGKTDGGNCMEKEVELHAQILDVNDAGLVQPSEANEYCSEQIYSLRFEVSKYTGRIHLYECVPGVDARPRPLYENFRPEELESLHSYAANEDDEHASSSVKCNPAYRHALIAFIDEWNELRPIQRRKLLGKTLQLPLTVELCYLNENVNHSKEGLLKGGSKRRFTPWCEINHPLPPNAVWKNIVLSSSHGNKEKRYNQGWTLKDEPLCKLCQTPCKGPNAKAPEYFEDLFCNLDCYEEYRTRTSGRFLRQELFELENGVCTNCQLDCHRLVMTIKPLSEEKRREYITKVAPKVASREKLLEKLVKDPSEGNAWHADHVVPVYKGGGECRLENMRTLCVACHCEVTAAQNAERRMMRANARKQLKALMKSILDRNPKDTVIGSKDREDSKSKDGLEDDELLVNVPGSAYTKVEESKSSNSKLS